MTSIDASRETAGLLPSPGNARHQARWSAFRSQLQVLHALILHDVKSRMFGNGLGYIVTILWPLAHICVVVSFHYFKMTGQVIYGSSIILYVSTGVLPYISWVYLFRNCNAVLSSNGSFLSYPIIKPLDLVIARAILDFISTFVIIIMVVTILALCSINPVPFDLLQAVLGQMSAAVLGLGFGFFSATFGCIFKIWRRATMLIIMSIHITSGIFFEPEQLPETARNVLWFNPLLHSVEWVRSAYFLDYAHSMLNKTYVLSVGLIMFGLGCMFVHVFDRQIRQK